MWLTAKKSRQHRYTKSIVRFQKKKTQVPSWHVNMETKGNKLIRMLKSWEHLILQHYRLLRRIRRKLNEGDVCPWELFSSWGRGLTLYFLISFIFPRRSNHSFVPVNAHLQLSTVIPKSLHQTSPSASCKLNLHHHQYQRLECFSPDEWGSFGSAFSLHQLQTTKYSFILNIIYSLCSPAGC